MGFHLQTPATRGQHFNIQRTANYGKQAPLTSATCDPVHKVIFGIVQFLWLLILYSVASLEQLEQHTAQALAFLACVSSASCWAAVYMMCACFSRDVCSCIITACRASRQFLPLTLLHCWASGAQSTSISGGGAGKSWAGVHANAISLTVTSKRSFVCQLPLCAVLDEDDERSTVVPVASMESPKLMTSISRSVHSAFHAPPGMLRPQNGNGEPLMWASDFCHRVSKIFKESRFPCRVCTTRMRC